MLALDENQIGTCQQHNAPHWLNETCMTSAMHEVCLSLNKQNDASEDLLMTCNRLTSELNLTRPCGQDQCCLNHFFHCLSMRNSNVSIVHQAYCCRQTGIIAWQHIHSVWQPVAGKAAASTIYDRT